MADPDASALRQELASIQEQIRNLTTMVANQQSVYVDIAGARTAELRAALSGIESLASNMRSETERLRQLQDAISHHLHDLVLDVVQPELRSQLTKGLPKLIMEAMAPELRGSLVDLLPEAVAAAVSPEVGRLLSEWLPVVVADTVQPEVREAVHARLPDITAAAVQPELRRVLAERLPHLVADTVQPELYRTLAERLPAVVGDAVTPSVRDAVLGQLPHLVTETVRPEVRESLEQRLPGVVAQVVSPDVRRVLAERLPHLVAETVQPELRQTLADHLPHLVADAVQPEVRETLDLRLPGVVAQIVSPEVRRVLAERLPHLVAETVQPELRQVLAERLPGIVAESVSPSVGALLAERVPGMLAETVTPELTVTLAEMEGSAAELRHEAAKLRSLREVVADRLPESVIGAIEPHLQEVITVRFPRLVAELVDPVLRQVMSDQLPDLVARAVQPEMARTLGQRVPELVAEAVRPELRQMVSLALETRLPDVVAEAVRPELRQRLGEILPMLIAEVVTPTLASTLSSDLPGLVGEKVAPDLSVSLAEVEASAAEMRAETARLRGLRETVADRLPQAVMAAVNGVLEQTVASRLPELLGELVRPALQEAVALPLPSAVDQFLEPALRSVLVAELPGLVQTALEREVRESLAESLPALVASSTEASAEQLAGVRQDLVERLSAMAQQSLVAPLSEFQTTTTDYRAEAERLRSLRAQIAEELPRMVADAAAAAAASQPPAIPAADVPGMVQDALAIALTDVEATASHLRAETQRLGSLRQDVARELPGMVGDAVVAALASHPSARAPAVDAPGVEAVVSAAMAEMEASAAELRAEAARLRTLRQEVAQELPRLVADTVAAALARQPSPPSPPSPPPDRGAGSTAPPPASPNSAPWTASPPPPPAEPSEPAPTSEAPGAAPESAVTGTWGSTGGPGATAATAAGTSSGPPDPVPPPAGASAPPVAPPEPAPAPAPAPSSAMPQAGDAAAAVAAPPGGTGAGPAPACVLPGVTVGPTLARGISNAASRARLRRRRRRRAGPPAPGLHRRDPFGSELTQRLEWFALARRQAPNGAVAADGREPGSLPAGERDGREVSLPIGRLRGVTVLGPGAREAVRALVLTFLAEHGPESGRAIVVGDLFPPGRTFPGLARTREVGSVLGALQAEVDRRRQLLADAGVDDLAGYQARRPDEPLPLVVVAGSNLPVTDAGRLVDVLEQAGDVGIMGVLADTPVGSLPALRLEGPGRVAGASSEGPLAGLAGVRLFGVERDPAGELLDVLASARVDAEGEPQEQPKDEPFRAVPSESALISVHLLGPYRIEAEGREVRAGLRAKARELLAFYLLHPEGTTLEEATEALWPEADPRRGSEWFWTALGNLRSRLRAATANQELKVIERDGDRYRIEALFDVDLWRFESALAAASTTNGDPTWTQTLEAAAALYEGELLAGTDWPWADIPRDDLRGRAVDVLVSLAATRLVHGDVRGALEALERAIAIDPLAEQLYRRIMRLHAKLSRPDQVDATFKALKARLGEYDLEPSVESVKLHQELGGSR